jgi:hypothetical protein
LYAFLISTIRATGSAHLILLDLIVIIEDIMINSHRKRVRERVCKREMLRTVKESGKKDRRKFVWQFWKWPT